MKLKKQREIFLIYGKTGSGKSTLAKKLSEGYKRIIYLDPMSEYSGTVVENFEDFLSYVENKENFVVCCRFYNDLDYEYLFKAVFEISNVLLVIEEADLYISPREKRNDFLKLVKFGRHRDISIIGIARRVSELSIDFRSQCDKIYSFKQTDPKDIKILQDIGFNINNIQNLGEFQYEILET